VGFVIKISLSYDIYATVYVVVAIGLTTISVLLDKLLVAVAVIVWKPTDPAVIVTEPEGNCGPEVILVVT
jgi:hypothetical protein